MSVKNIFKKYNNEYLKFELVENKLNQRPDLNALLLLDKILPVDGQPVIAAADHEIIYLGVELKNLQGTDENIIRDLIRSGVSLDDDGSLYMFV